MHSVLLNKHLGSMDMGRSRMFDLECKPVLNTQPQPGRVNLNWWSSVKKKKGGWGQCSYYWTTGCPVSQVLKSEMNPFFINLAVKSPMENIIDLRKCFSSAASTVEMHCFQAFLHLVYNKTQTCATLLPVTVVAVHWYCLCPLEGTFSSLKKDSLFFFTISRPFLYQPSLLNQTHTQKRIKGTKSAQGH